MPKRTNLFQKLLHHIHSQLSDNAIVTESKMLTDRITGEEREVDIVIETKSGEYKILLSVEVKDENRKVTVEWVEQQSCKHNTLPTDKLILVSRSGFSQSALKKAAHLGIETATIEAAISNDWVKIISLLSKGKYQEIKCKFVCKAIYEKNGKREISSQLQFDQLLYSETYPDVRVTVGFMAHMMVDNLDVRNTIFDHIPPNSNNTYTLDFHFPSEFYFFIDSMKTNILILRMELEVLQKEMIMELQPGSFRSFDIAWGKSTDKERDALITFVKQEQNGQLFVKGFIEDEEGLRTLQGQISEEEKQ